MIQIDIDADLSMVDDEDRNLARRPVDPPWLKVGGVAVAGRPGFWSWALIEEITTTSVFFRQISWSEAAEHGELAIAASAAAPWPPRFFGIGESNDGRTDNARRAGEIPVDGFGD